jgi:hypothetical protein
MSQLGMLGVIRVMRFVTTRATINPAWLGVTVSPKTPGFEHANQLPKGFRLEVTDPEHIDRVKGGDFTILDDGSPKSAAAIAKIDAEVAAELKAQKEMARKKRAEAAPKDTQWDKKPVGNVTLMVIGGVIVLIIAAILAHYFPHWFHS